MIFTFGCRKLVLWNILAAGIVVAFFVTSIFIDCDNTQIAGSRLGKINKPFCAHSCFCSENVPFMPVCPENGIQTYYSPCHGEFVWKSFDSILIKLHLKAGCGAEILINSIRFFGNCSCGIDTEIQMVDVMTTEGACGMDECQPFWISHQVGSVIAR